MDNFFIHFFHNSVFTIMISGSLAWYSWITEIREYPDLCKIHSLKVHWCHLSSVLLRYKVVAVCSSTKSGRTYWMYQWERTSHILGRFSFCDPFHNRLTSREIINPKTELWKKWMQKLSALTFLFGNIFSSGQKYHSCPTRKSLKNAKLKSEHQNTRNELKISFGL